MIGPQFFRDLDILELRQVDGADVEPVVVSKFNLHAGARADVVVCADQEPGNFLMTATSAAGASFAETGFRMSISSGFYRL